MKRQSGIWKRSKINRRTLKFIENQRTSNDFHWNSMNIDWELLPIKEHMLRFFDSPWNLIELNCKSMKNPLRILENLWNSKKINENPKSLKQIKGNRQSVEIYWNSWKFDDNLWKFMGNPWNSLKTNEHLKKFIVNQRTSIDSHWKPMNK